MWIFWLIAILMVISALGVVLSKNLFRSAIYLGATLVLTALIYLLLHAELLAFIQILLYTGGVATLLVFAIMLTQRIVGEDITQQSRSLVGGAIASLAVLLILFFFLSSSQLRFQVQPLPENLNLELGKNLFVTYVLPFEVLSVLLLAAIIGAIVMARRDR